MNWGKACAIAQIVLAVGAGLGYLAQGNYRMAIYWGAAAVITGSVTL